MDLESYKYWDDISKVLDMMLKATDSKHAPWYIVRSDDKRRARLNCISHLLSLIPYEGICRKKAKLPKRIEKNKYADLPSLRGRHFVPERRKRHYPSACQNVREEIHRSGLAPSGSVCCAC